MKIAARTLKEIVVKVKEITPVGKGRTRILFYPEKRKRKKRKEKPAAASEPLPVQRAVSEPLERFPGLVDSVVFPGLIYNLFQGTVVFQDKTRGVPPGVFRLLWFLENCAGKAARDAVLGSCWHKSGSDSALWHAVGSANKLLAEIGISAFIEGGSDEIAVAPVFRT